MDAAKHVPELNSDGDHRSGVAEPGRESFPIVGIGASAGGLRAFETFFDTLPDRPGMGFVLVQHLDPHHESELAEILQNHTRMPVNQVAGKEAIRRNHVYVIPPGQSLSIEEGILYLSEPEEPRGRRAPIDRFFRSLADDQEENAICIILSGTGNDGTLGMKRVKERGGIVLVQAPDDAEYDGMPRSALSTGVVDMAAPVAELAQKLVDYRESAEQISFPDSEAELADAEASVLQQIFAQLNRRTGADFSHYKRSTTLRRLQRRMQVTQTATPREYLRLLHRDGDEANALFKDFLISVTNFFRDPDAWEVLAREVVPALFADKGQGSSIRAWVPGCATGEEAYSLAILLLEEAQRRHSPVEIQIFATDLNGEAIAFARRGRYPEAVVADISQERLERFFEVEGSGYRVRQEVQEIVLFAEHNLIKDAPFARLDLISCRNLLIYLQREIQERIFQIFRYALGDGGYLFLGSSESITQGGDWFEPVRKRQRIYRAAPGQPPLPQLPVRDEPAVVEQAGAVGQEPGGHPRPRADVLGERHRELMLSRYAPPSVLVDADYDIRYKYGEVGRYLRHRQGKPSLNLLENVSSQMRVELRTGLYSVFRSREPVKPRRVTLGENGEQRRVRLRIELVPPVDGEEDALALVIFEPVRGHRQEPPEGGDRDVDPALMEQLEEELTELRHRLQTTVEEYETSNEELKSSNEELQSMNEELRSTTEELETSREELRSTNEELSSVNQELKTKVDELRWANSDLENLMEATDIATLFLDRDLCLKRYTPEATEVFHLIPSDTGRPFNHISHKIEHDKLPEMAGQVLKTLGTIEEEVHSTDGRWFLLQMSPYRTLDDKIDGVVITLVEITAQLEAERSAQRRAIQQAAVTDLGLIALRGTPLVELMGLAVRKVAAILDVSYAKVLQLDEAEDEMLLIAGVGWQEGLVGTARVGTGADSQAGYTLRSEKPVFVSNLGSEKRFNGPALLTDHGVVSGISATVPGLDRPFGVLGAHSEEERSFTAQDADFLQAIANVLAAAIERQQAEVERDRLVEELKSLTAGLEERVAVRTEALEKRSEQLTAVASALTVAEQRERERISQILHDDLQQLLHAAQLRLMMLEGELDGQASPLREHLAEIESLNDRALTVTRSLTVELRPPVLEGEGLAEAFAWLAGHMENVYGLQVEVIAAAEVEPANEDLRELSFQMVRELLFNVVKHADVNKAQLVLWRQEGQCALMVVDDGEGFDPDELEAWEANGAGYGLRSIRERLELFGGRMEIETAQGEGVKVTLLFPCVGGARDE